MQPNLSELTAFIAVAENMSFRGAARALDVSPSALSHSIQSFEARLGTRLFNRTTRSVALTDAGSQLLQRVGPAMDGLNAALNETISNIDQPNGTVRISAAESAASMLISHMLPAFTAANPGIHIEFVVDTRFVDIVADGFDAGMRLYDQVPKDMIAIRIGSDLRFAAVASPAYLAAHPAPRTPLDLMQHQCIRFRFESGALYRWDFAAQGKPLIVDVDGPMTLGNVRLMVDAALAGIGVAWVPTYAVSEHLATGRLIDLLPAWCQPFAGLCFYYPSNRYQPPAMKLFTQALRDWASGF